MSETAQLAMDPKPIVVYTYTSARDRGESRSAAFLRAVEAYRARRPDLPANRAGTEVARILLAAMQTMAASSSAVAGTLAAEDASAAEPL